MVWNTWMYYFLIEIFAFPALEIAMELMQISIMAMASLNNFMQLEEEKNKKRNSWKMKSFWESVWKEKSKKNKNVGYFQILQYTKPCHLYPLHLSFKFFISSMGSKTSHETVHWLLRGALSATDLEGSKDAVQPRGKIHYIFNSTLAFVSKKSELLWSIHIH